VVKRREPGGTKREPSAKAIEAFAAAADGGEKSFSSDPAAIKPIQFKVPASMHQELKLYAVQQNMSMTDLFLAMYKEYRSKHG
jgi:hypothetical protein